LANENGGGDNNFNAEIISTMLRQASSEQQ
jgi:hypothetical protein